MANVYNEEFKKQLVKEYIQGKSYSILPKEYGIAKSTLSGWIKKYSEECQLFQPHRQLPYLFFKRYTRTSQEHCRTGKRESFLKKSRGILRKRSRWVVYRFLDQYKKVFGLRWLLRKFQLSPNAYYNYLKQRKSVYQEQKNSIHKEIKSIYYNNNRLPGHRSMRIFLQRKGIHLSKTTVHKYMNKDLSLHAIVMRKKTKYRREVKNKIFSNLLKQDFRSEGKNRIWCTDFTYIRLSNGTMRYNCSILDL